MGKIRILPEVLSNKIAAGEVVERPASVVKELAENALDAGGSRIVVEVAHGGRSLIRVSDNGCGMDPDDALLAVERYATSKITADRDLFDIRTLGFRGEALPSIASVSRFLLQTRDRASEAGVEVAIDGGTVKNVTRAGMPVGTMVTVRQLFFNTPARRKFLKTVATEMGHITDALTGMALAWPQTRFKLTHNGKTVKNWPPAKDPSQRVFDVLGSRLAGSLFPVQARHADLELSGWLCSSRISRKTPGGIHVFVNGRAVRDRVVQRALFTGYRDRLMKGRYPVAVLFLKVPFDQVDVNVHPTKDQVRFARHGAVHDAVARAVRETLQRREGLGDTTPQQLDFPKQRQTPRISEQKKTFAAKPASGAFRPAESRADPDAARGEPAAAAMRTPARKLGQSHSQRPVWTQKRFADLRVIGQFRNSYILCEGSSGLVLIDQHAAHERVCYEQLKRAYARGGQGRSQMLLAPEIVELSHGEAAHLEALLPQLQKAGLEIEAFGGSSFAVRAVPALLAGAEAAPLVVEIAEQLALQKDGQSLTDALDDCLKLAACHGAIRARQRLADKEIGLLLRQLDGCRDPSHCPHGRPIWLRWSLDELEKAFGRKNI